MAPIDSPFRADRDGSMEKTTATGAMEGNDWERLRAEGLRERLSHIRNLLQQAAAVGLAQDVSRLETLAHLHHSGTPHGPNDRRRYR
jgi:hypothetical protein